MNLRDLIMQIEGLGYNDEDATARVCQDIVLKGIAQSTLSRSVTIKGGVVMRSLTGNIRRATQEMDIAFDDKGASLPINSREQMVAEKLSSLLKFGRLQIKES